MKLFVCVFALTALLATAAVATAATASLGDDAMLLGADSLDDDALVHDADADDIAFDSLASNEDAEVQMQKRWGKKKASDASKVRSFPANYVANNGVKTRDSTWQPNFSTKTMSKCPLATDFSYPMGRKNKAGQVYCTAKSRGTYVARGFKGYWREIKGYHTGADVNGVNGYDTDKGDPIWSIGAGIVTVAHNFKGGWGNIVRVLHRFKSSSGDEQWAESFYGHLEKIMVKVGQVVAEGQQVGTCGKGHNNQYWAHLHFQVQTNINMMIGAGYAPSSAWLDNSKNGYTDPMKWVAKHSKRC